VTESGPAWFYLTVTLAAINHPFLSRDKKQRMVYTCPNRKPVPLNYGKPGIQEIIYL
jgi:hypothetical protein